MLIIFWHKFWKNGETNNQNFIILAELITVNFFRIILKEYF